MSRKIAVKLIMQLRANGLSQSAIARAKHVSKHSVQSVFKIADERNITFESIKDLTPPEVYELFFLERHIVEKIYKKLDYDYIHTESSDIGVGCTKFCGVDMQTMLRKAS